MTERSKSKSRLFFIEILIIIVFFSICAGVCMNLFAKAKLISVESSDLTKGVMVAQAAAEAVKAEGDSPELERLLSKMDGLLNEDTVRALNAKVDIDGMDARDVAHGFLVEKGLVPAP